MAWMNAELGRLFGEIATLLRLQGADHFRVRAYERAAGAISAAPVDLASLSQDEIAKLKGIGTSTAKRIAEYRATGTIGMLEELRAAVPPGFAELVKVPGLGPKTAQLLHERLGVDGVESLRAALEAGRLRGLPGLGQKTEENLRAGLERMGRKQDDRVPVSQALDLAEEICRRLCAVPGVIEVATAGSLRRMRETIGDIDVLAATSDPAAVMGALRDSDLVIRVLADGEKKLSVLTARGLQVDVRAVAPEEWGAALVYFTGSKEHNVRIRERAVRRGLTLNEYGLMEKETQERVAGRTEEDVYAALDLPWIPPPLREDRGEVEAAAAGTLPVVVTVEDIRGDLHCHTDWSGDGRVPLEEMAAALEARGYEYVLITDHAENLRLNGISRERMCEQRALIDEVGARHPALRILQGAELNIGVDGDLDYDAEFLAGYDLAVASIHSHFSRDHREQTARLIKAMEHPAVTVIGHPTGRKIGRRPGYEFDVDAVVEAAVRTGTALEVNASPDRLDLSGELVRVAVEAGARLAIDCDAHRLRDLDNLRYGVATAQRGWATPEHVVNTWPLDRLLAFAAAKR